MNRRTRKPLVSSPCVADTSSVIGLSALVRSRPDDWHELLRRRAASVRLDRHAIVGDLIGTRVDAAALPRSRRDLGRLRSARWCASVLARHAAPLRVLAVTSESADRIEARLIECGLAPSSARKVRAHLVQLRGCVARELGVVVPPIDPPAAAPAPWTPRLDWSGYGATREWLSSVDAAACDLVAACHLRPSTVLRLRVRDVGDGGRTVRVRGRRVRHVLPVPAFLREDLLELARGGEPAAPLFPGRSQSHGLSVVTLRRRFKAATRGALDTDLDLRDLADLATATLGAGSANPSGRRVALGRIARRWVALEEPPSRVESNSAVVPRERGLRRRLERAEDRVSGLEASASRTARRLRSSKKAAERSVSDLRARSEAQDRSIQDLRWEMRAALDGLSERLAQVERRGGSGPKAARRQAAEVVELRTGLDSVQEKVTKIDGALRRTRSAVRTNAGLTTALIMDRAVTQQSKPSSVTGAAQIHRGAPGVRPDADAIDVQVHQFFEALDSWERGPD